MRGSAPDRCNGNGHPAKDGSKRIFTGGGYCLPPARECPAPWIVRIWPLLRHSIWRGAPEQIEVAHAETVVRPLLVQHHVHALEHRLPPGVRRPAPARRHWRGRRQLIGRHGDRKSTRLNSSHEWISYAVFCLKK